MGLLPRSSLALPLLLTAGCTGTPAPPPPPTAIASNGPPAGHAGLAGHATPPAPGWYRDITDTAKVAATYRNGEEADRYAILESLGGGVAVLDYDGDGRMDLFFPGGGFFDGPDKRLIKGHPPKLFRNTGDGTFADVTAAAGLDTLADGQPWFYTHGAAVADYDRDGFPDLLVTGYGRVALFRNEPAGSGRRFREVTKAAGLLAGGHFWSTSAAFGDLDGDGWPDLYLCQYVDWSNENDPRCGGYFVNVPQDVCPPKQFAARPHALFHNKQNGTFADVTKAAGIRCDRPDHDYGKGLGVLFVDVDADGRPEIYVANDTTDNFLYLNRSTPGTLRFEERGLELGVARDGGGSSNGSMGVDAADYDGTGRPSLFVANYENEFHALYQNHTADGRMRFAFVTPQAGLGVIGPSYVGFGTLFVDADMDGWPDLVINNGHVIRHSPKGNVRQQPILFRNGERAGRRYFQYARDRAGPFFAEPRRGRGLAAADLFNRGGHDLIFCYLNEPARVLAHDRPAGAHWLGLRLTPAGHADPTGARVVVAAGGRDRTQFATAGRAYLSSSDRRMVFGLGDTAAVESVTVHWPSGTPRREVWAGLKPDAYHDLAQGTGRAVGGGP